MLVGVGEKWNEVLNARNRARRELLGALEARAGLQPADMELMRADEY